MYLPAYQIITKTYMSKTDKQLKLYSKP